MKSEEIGLKLSPIMTNVSVCEGLIYAKTSGEVIIGQTLTEMDHNSIAKNVADMFKIKIPALEKGEITDLTIGVEEGTLLAVIKDDEMVIGVLGEDGKSSVGLLLRQLKNIMK
jgi:hypothetical protein